MSDQTVPADWIEIVKGIDADQVLAADFSVLTARVNIDPTLIKAQVTRVRNPEEFRKRWLQLQTLAEGNLTLEQRRAIYSDLAIRLEGLIGWQGNPDEGPGW